MKVTSHTHGASDVTDSVSLSGLVDNGIGNVSVTVQDSPKHLLLRAYESVY